MSTRKNKKNKNGNAPLNYTWDFIKHIVREGSFASKRNRQNDNASKQIILEYEKKYGELDTLEDTPFYKDYLSHFDVSEIIDYIHFPDSPLEFDKSLLLLLIVSSLSSEYKPLFNRDINLFEWKITVTAGDAKTSKLVSELDLFQILSLYIIYISEEIQLYSELDEEEYSDLHEEQEKRIAIYNMRVSQMKSDLASIEKSTELMNELDALIS